MKKILIAAIVITSGIIASCSNQRNEGKIVARSSQVVLTAGIKNIATAD
jgi:outer membrane murein-binding lipoprotein Lpp